MSSPPAEADPAKGARLRLGWKAYVVLIVQAVVEWYITIIRVPGLLWYLIVINVGEAGLIAYYFMHVAQLWRDHEPAEHQAGVE